MLTSMFRDRERTEIAYNTLQERGYKKDDINLVMSDETRKKYFSGDVEDTEIGTKAAEGAGKGSAIGGTVGAIAGVIATLGTSLVIPGLGIVLAGPIVAGLAGAGAGGFTGRIIGALAGSGIPEARAKLYESGIKKATAKKCEAMEGLIKEGAEIMEENEEGAMRDAGIISAGQKIEHYEIASYGTLHQFAETLGLTEAEALLEETLGEENAADQKLTEVAVSAVNIEASELEKVK